jgi:hypothetical protein
LVPENENYPQLSTHVPISTYDNLRAVLQNQPEDENVLPFKLPQIGKKHFEVVEESRNGCEKGSCDNVIA